MQDLRKMPAVPRSWPSAGIVDARAFRVGYSRTVHRPTHATPNGIRAACGLHAHIVERDGRLACWADADWDCPRCAR